VTRRISPSRCGDGETRAARQNTAPMFVAFELPCTSTSSPIFPLPAHARAGSGSAGTVCKAASVSAPLAWRRSPFLTSGGLLKTSRWSWFGKEGKVETPVLDAGASRNAWRGGASRHLCAGNARCYFRIVKSRGEACGRRRLHRGLQHVTNPARGPLASAVPSAAQFRRSLHGKSQLSFSHPREGPVSTSRSNRTCITSTTRDLHASGPDCRKDGFHRSRSASPPRSQILSPRRSPPSRQARDLSRDLARSSIALRRTRDPDEVQSGDGARAVVALPPSWPK